MKRVKANTKYNTVGFSLMNCSSLKIMVKPPKRTIMIKPAHCTFSIGLFNSLSVPIKIIEAIMAAPVA